MFVSLLREPQPGDHLVSPRLGFEHHGLYLGNQLVMHYAGGVSTSGAGEPDGVERVSMATFTQGNIFRVESHPYRRFTHDEAITRAWLRLGEQRYHPAFNNCEHFVNWCFNGFKTSSQVNNAVYAASVVANEYTKRKGAEATAVAAYMALHESKKEEIERLQRKVERANKNLHNRIVYDNIVLTVLSVTTIAVLAGWI